VECGMWNVDVPVDSLSADCAQSVHNLRKPRGFLAVLQSGA
jgi:hypothetical protein